MGDRRTVWVHLDCPRKHGSHHGATTCGISNYDAFEVDSSARYDPKTGRWFVG